VTCRRVAGQRLGKHIPSTPNTQARIRQLPFLCKGGVNTRIEEAVFSMWFAYIHCWATDVFPIVPPQDYISSPVVEREGSMGRVLGSQERRGWLKVIVTDCDYE
jgi:hypothetical protein